MSDVDDSVLSYQVHDGHNASMGTGGDYSHPMVAGTAFGPLSYESSHVATPSGEVLWETGDAGILGTIANTGLGGSSTAVYHDLPWESASFTRPGQQYVPPADASPSSLSNMASVEAAFGNMTLAKSLYEEALHRQEAAAGPDHPMTLHMMSRLASVHAALGDQAFEPPELLLMRRELCLELLLARGGVVEDFVD